MNNLSAADITCIDTLIRRQGSGAHHLIPLLQAVQEQYHYLPHPVLEYIATATDSDERDIWGAATFFDQFRLRPAGKHRIRVCVGTACHIQGADEIYRAFRDHLSIIDGNDTDSEGLFTVEKVACLGCCMLAPAVQIDETIYGHLSPGTVGYTLEDFLARTEKPFPERAEAPSGNAGEVRLCLCSSCLAAGASQVSREVQRLLLSLKIPAGFKSVSCHGLAYLAPLLEVVPRSGPVVRYPGITSSMIEGILLDHFGSARRGLRVKGVVHRLSNLLLRPDALPPEKETTGPCGLESSLDFLRMSTEHGGEMAPLDIGEYRQLGGFKALDFWLSEKTPEDVLEILQNSGLRGRGGAGFPAYRKWQVVHNQPAAKKYLVCNGDEGDPGAFMDRMLLESFPLRILEGMALAAWTLGITMAFLFIRSEYPVAVERVRRAIALCEQERVLGRNAIHSGLRITFRVIRGAGAFVCGEETALLEAIEGRRGIPRSRPPYPSEKGLWGCPTLINNVETFSMVPWILREGAEAFAAHGTLESRGTKTFALAGKINRSGLIEVPLGITIAEIIRKYGGGMREGSTLKAVQIGGPSGGCIPAELADTPVDFDSLQKIHAIMGSGGMVVLDQHDCMVEMARYFSEFTKEESCGRCTYCRIGTARMLAILEGFCEGRAREKDLEELEYLAQHVRERSCCGLGKNAPNPVISTLRHFRHEYEAHMLGHCPAGSCRSLIRYEVDESCIGCTKCSQVCPVDAVSGNPWERHAIDDQVCIRCGSCQNVCPQGAVNVLQIND
jgi:NADH:ubiquinone oxidoreductase subunit F (NADH-binding)/NADH:ubiquinone oxidoreductase subunit E/NAD-dependent dihydropyrimidine dehydrogenase PreA subunit